MKISFDFLFQRCPFWFELTSQLFLKGCQIYEKKIRKDLVYDICTLEHNPVHLFIFIFIVILSVTPITLKSRVYNSLQGLKELLLAASVTAFPTTPLSLSALFLLVFSPSGTIVPTTHLPALLLTLILEQLIALHHLALSLTVSVSERFSRCRMRLASGRP